MAPGAVRYRTLLRRTLPETDADFSTRWRLVKHFVAWRFAAGVAAAVLGHVIRDERDFTRHFDYIHANPVRYGLGARAADWPHSRFGRYVRKGVYERDWYVEDDGLDLE